MSAQEITVKRLLAGETVTITPTEDTTCDLCQADIKVGGIGLMVPTGKFDMDGTTPYVVVACSSKCRQELIDGWETA